MVGDVFDRMAELPDGSVDLILTSPPFLALRSYLPPDHPDKAKEIGSEPTPAEFIDTLLALTAEWRRVLAPHGSIAVELGDTYSGSGGAGGDYAFDGWRAGQEPFKGSGSRTRRSYGHGSDGLVRGHDGRGNIDLQQANAGAWPLGKSLCLIPQAYAMALSYGIHPLTGEPSPAGQWRVRNVVAWCRPNPPVGALGDKFRPATSYMTIACVGRSRYFDLDAVRQPLTDRAERELAVGGVRGGESYQGEAADGSGYNGERTRRPADGGGAPPLDWWEIPTAPYAGSHYATWPPALCKRPIEAMVPHRVCLTCGKPSERITGPAEYHQSPNAHGSGRAPGDVAARTWESGIAKGKNQSADLRDGGVVRVAPTLGWTDCGHDSWRNGIVLDPFAGSGTTLAVATGCGRDAIGIDLDERNAHLAAERVGMFLEVESRRLEEIG